MTDLPPPPPPFPTGPSGYGAPGYGGQLANHPQGTTILVLGILSVVICGLLGPVALVMGGKARKEIKANPGRYASTSTVTAGWVLGIVGTALLVLGLVWVVLVIIVGVSAGTST